MHHWVGEGSFVCDGIRQAPSISFALNAVHVFSPNHLSLRKMFQFVKQLVLAHGNEALCFVVLFCKGFAELPERVKLLRISSSLSEDEVRKLKFDARSKGKVDGHRYEEIKEGLDLFDELENNGELSHLCVSELLQGIHRSDLVDILAQPGTGKRTSPLL